MRMNLFLASTLAGAIAGPTTAIGVEAAIPRCITIVTCVVRETVVSESGTNSYQTIGTSGNDDGGCWCDGETCKPFACIIHVTVKMLYGATDSGKLDGGGCLVSPDGLEFRIDGQFDVTACGAEVTHVWQRWANGTCAGNPVAQIGIQWKCDPATCVGTCP